MKLKNFLSILTISAVTSFTATSCMINTVASKNEATSTYEVNTSYKSLKVKNAIRVEYRHDIDTLQIIADSSILSKIKVNYDDEGIEIYASDFRRSYSVTAIVPASKDLKSIEIGGASSFTSDGEIKAEKLDIEVSGASHFDANIDCQSLEVSVSGASSAEIGGKAVNANIEVSGASKLSSNGEYLNTDYADVDISGASTAEIICNKNITGEASGASKLSFRGAAKADVSTSGASKAVRK
ncbi:DUF2807 domain-containing protein [uncultured Bacteroides sp.]|uniref:GIN domain-containing protein n=1 Tax=uncultured Bacteroides sp. TaxID=162156 RepID=UPI002597F9F0|nr:DUF2807 domain-containing protein [uncultured Bacteroides sp.]